MLLSEIITTIKSVALSHYLIESFDMGDNHLIEGNIEHQYPKFFLETPFSISFPVTNKQQWYTVSFAFLVLMNKKEDNTIDQIEGVSEATLITEQILAKLRTLLSVQQANSLTYNDYTNEGLSTCRTDITINVLLNQCETPAEMAQIFNK